MASVRFRITARYRTVFSDCGSCSSKSRYPHTAVSGVRRSWEMLVTAAVSSSFPVCSRTRSLRRAYSCRLIRATSARTVLSPVEMEIRVFVSVPSFSSSSSATSRMERRSDSR